MRDWEAVVTNHSIRTCLFWVICTLPFETSGTASCGSMLNNYSYNNYISKELILSLWKWSQLHIQPLTFVETIFANKTQPPPRRQKEMLRCVLCVEGNGGCVHPWGWCISQRVVFFCGFGGKFNLFFGYIASYWSWIPEKSSLMPSLNFLSTQHPPLSLESKPAEDSSGKVRGLNQAGLCLYNFQDLI